MPDTFLNGKLWISFAHCPQNAINRQFSELYTIAEGDDPLEKLVVTQTSGGKSITTMECKLGSPEAVLDIASGVVKTSVLFRIKFEDGYFLVPTFGEPK
ncbi:hypothetical protein BYT27DRAFT_6863282 [Phlegmacium glaucopus]|nr:hypothetical protein BYT27DRAFT_6863282 [Phlegmacium glaucopus]